MGPRTFRTTHDLSPCRKSETEYTNVHVCHRSAARVVTTMKMPGMSEYFVGARTRAKWIEINMMARPARSWFAPPKYSHRAHQLPETANAHGTPRPTAVATCLFPNRRNRPSPQVSAATSRKKRVTSAWTVSAYTMRTRPKNVVSTMFAASTPRSLETRSAAPTGHDATLVWEGFAGSPGIPKTNAGVKTMYAMSEASANNPSESIAPPPTGSASVSTSRCFEDDELLTRLCHPEIAPQAIATKRIGQIGPRIPWGSLRYGPMSSWIPTGGLAPIVKGVASAPTRMRTIAATAG